MDVFAALRARKMTRSFRSDQIAQAQLDLLTYAATRGPSAGNTASVESLLLTDQSVDEYWDIALPADRREKFPWPGLLSAPVLLILTVAPAAYVERYSEPDKARTGLGESTESWSVPYWWVDGGAAVENVLLGAQALGLGACFFGQFDNESAVSAHFGIPPERRSLGTIALGHADPASDRPSKSADRNTRSITERTHHNRW